MATMRLSTPLRKYSGGKPEVTVEGETLLEVLEKFDSKHPGFAEKIIENGEIKRFVNVFVNNIDVRTKDGLNTKIEENDTISILPAVSGG